MGNAVLRAGGRALASVVAIAAAMSVSPVMAQDAPEKEIQITPQKVESAPDAAPAAAAPAAAPAAGSVAATGAAKSAWVKLCEKAPLVKKGADGKDVKEEKQLCLTHHERLDGNTGMVLVSAAIREVEGQDKKSLMIMVPLGMAIPPGIRAAVYSKEQWAAASKNEKIDEKQLKPIELKYALCHPAGCTAETEATAEILDEMSKGGGIMVLAMNAAAQPIGFPVPLDGYNEAAAGPPVDNKKYAEARSQLMQQIRARQQQMAEKFKEDQLKNLPTDAPGAPPTTTGSTSTKADKKTAKKKKADE
jgi:invasion protein IalB